MVIFELSILNIVIGVVGAISATLFAERVLTWHSSKIITIQKRGDEFIEYSKIYYLPMAHLVASIEIETNPDYNVRPKILFFKIAKYLNFFSNFLDKGGGFVFPKYSQECKVAKCSDTFNSAINLLIFNDDKEVTERVIEYYKKNPDILSFIEKIDTSSEYTTFESICKNAEISGKLYEYGNALCNSITKGVTEEYKTWYKFEFRKKNEEQNINKDAEQKIVTIKKLYDDIHNKKGNNMEKVPHSR